MSTKIPKYLSIVIKKHPKIKSGRKNYLSQHNRIIKQINLTKNFLKQYA